MKRVMFLLFLGVFLLAAAATAFAHGGGTGKVDAPTYVRQAIAFLEGTQNVEGAEERIRDALALQSDQVNPENLQQAQKALENGSLEEAKALLVKALGKEPAGAQELTFHAGFKGSAGNYVLLLLAIIFIITGWGLIKRQVPKIREKGGTVHG